MSKGSKQASSQKANEIKDLLLDVIQQEESDMSETEIYRLSQPYKKPEAVAALAHDAPKQFDPVEDLDSDLELNFGHADPDENVIKVVNQIDVEKSIIKIDYDLNEDAASDVFEALSLQSFAKAAPPPEIPKSKNFQSEQTIKLNSPPQSRAPIELEIKEQNNFTPSNPNELTVRLTQKPKSRSLETDSKIANQGPTTSSGIKFKQESQIGISSPAEAVLKQSENLRIAQTRISSLEEELERLRQENSQLSSAGEILRRRADELLSQSEGFENKIQESATIFDEEKKVLKAQIQNKDRELEVRKQKIDQLEQRLNSQFDSIRRRERELEHRLEILKVENQDILNGKDKMILDLKRQVDLLNTEANFSKERTQELYGQHKDKQETIRRVVKALRMALTILEGDEETKAPLKKVD